MIQGGSQARLSHLVDTGAKEESSIMQVDLTRLDTLDNQGSPLKLGLKGYDMNSARNQ